MMKIQLVLCVVIGTTWAKSVQVELASPPPPPPPGGIPFNPGEQIAGPSSTQTFAEWFKTMQEWRKVARDPSWYNGRAYEDPQLKWTQTAYIQPQMHPYDRFFFDPTIGKYGNYTVQKWLDDVNLRYGGVDALLMWPTYTNIGIDDRSQFDLFEAMPGGVEGVRQAVDELHAAGVKVMIPYNPWDAGTLRCGEGATCGGNADLLNQTKHNSTYCYGPATSQNPGFCDARIMDSLIQNMNADGFNGDTMGLVPEEFYNVSVGLNHSVAIEPEGGGNVEEGPANWDTMGWGYWGYPVVPKVDTAKWQDSRRMTNICERWSKNHTNALQYALFNGVGFESWESVWGTWNGITKQDGEQIRRVATLLRFLGKRGYLQSQSWVPHSPTTDSTSLFASYWPSENGDNTAAWTVVNRDLEMKSGPTLVNVTAPSNFKFYDLYNGIEVTPTSAGVLSLTIERHGAVLATPVGPDSDPELKQLLSTMAGYAKTPIANYSPQWDYEYGARVPITRAETPQSTDGMVKIPGGPLRFAVEGVEIEGSGGAGDQQNKGVNPYGVDFQYEWETQPSRYHTQWVNLPEYYLDVTPVTQGAFHQYLLANPSALATDRYHYLMNWDWESENNPSPFKGNETLPVTYVGIEEARAFCHANGKRLPKEEEWQFAATGGGASETPYPWGWSAPNSSTMPPQLTGTKFPGPVHVGSYPAGASPFGILDLVGNVWQMTDEYQDTHTRSVIVKGGSNYRPSSSHWYFPQLNGNQFHNKYFLMNSRYERAGTLGFRCAADVPGSDTFDCGGKSLCGEFQAPMGTVDLTASKEWAMWNSSSTPIRSSTNHVSDAKASPSSNVLAGCAGTGSKFVVGDGTLSNGVCVASGSITFSVTDVAVGKEAVVSVYAGSTGAAAMITATLVDGGVSTVFTDSVTVTDNDIHSKQTYNLRWDLKFTVKAENAVLTVELTAPALLPPTPPPLPPPPPSPPPRCKSSLCGNIAQHKGDVVLSTVGSSDWVHFGLGDDLTSVNRKCNASALIHPLKLTGDGAAFMNSPQTFSWVNGGYEANTPNAAQEGSASETSTGIYSRGTKPGGFEFTVDIPQATADVIVYLYMGLYANEGVFSATLHGSKGGVEAMYNQTMSNSAASMMWTAITTLTVPSSSSQGTRTLSGTWTQTARSAKTHTRNIQFHAIAVDAAKSGIVQGTDLTHGVGDVVKCAASSGKSGNVILQAVVLN